MDTGTKIAALRCVAEWTLGIQSKLLDAAIETAEADRASWEKREELFRDGYDSVHDEEIQQQEGNNDDAKLANPYYMAGNRWHFDRDNVRQPRTTLVKLQETEVEINGEQFVRPEVVSTAKSPEEIAWSDGDFLNLCEVAGFGTKSMKSKQQRRNRLWEAVNVTQDNMMEYLWAFYADTINEYKQTSAPGIRQRVITRAFIRHHSKNEAMVAAIDVLTHVSSLKLSSSKFGDQELNVLQAALLENWHEIPDLMHELEPDELKAQVYEITKLVLDMPGGKELVNVEGMKRLNLLFEARVPLAVAVSRGFVNVAKLLLDNEADVNMTDSDGRNALAQSYGAPSEIPMMNLLLDHGANWNVYPTAGTMNVTHFASQDARVLLRDKETERIAKLEEILVIGTQEARVFAADEMYRYPPLFKVESNIIMVMDDDGDIVPEHGPEILRPKQIFHTRDDNEMVLAAIEDQNTTAVVLLLHRISRKNKTNGWGKVNGPGWKHMMNCALEFGLTKGEKEIVYFWQKSKASVNDSYWSTGPNGSNPLTIDVEHSRDADFTEYFARLSWQPHGNLKGTVLELVYKYQLMMSAIRNPYTADILKSLLAEIERQGVSVEKRPEYMEYATEITRECVKSWLAKGSSSLRF
jgi:hypothetical protein